MINFNDTFFLELFLGEIDAGETNGIKLTCDFCSFPDAKEIPNVTNIELFPSYIELYNQINDGGFTWELDKTDLKTEEVITKNEIVQSDVILNQDIDWKSIGLAIFLNVL